jgi:anthranilate synthase component I
MTQSDFLFPPSASLPENAADAVQALAAGKAALVWRQIIADSDTPVGAARRLMVEGRGDFLLESVEGGEVRGRYSLIGLDPDLVFRAHEDEASINCDWQADRAAFASCNSDPLTELRKLVAACRIENVPAALPPALACLVGYFGYETIGLVAKLPRAAQSPLDLPDMLFVRPTIILVFDSLTDQLFAIASICRALHWSAQARKFSCGCVMAMLPSARLPEPAREGKRARRTKRTKLACWLIPKSWPSISCCLIWVVMMWAG